MRSRHRCEAVDIPSPQPHALLTHRLYTRAEDTLSEEDLIFPRSVTRVGTKFQANVLSWGEQLEAEKRRPIDVEVGPSRLLCT